MLRNGRGVLGWLWLGKRVEIESGLQITTCTLLVSDPAENHDDGCLRRLYDQNPTRQQAKKLQYGPGEYEVSKYVAGGKMILAKMRGRMKFRISSSGRPDMSFRNVTDWDCSGGMTGVCNRRGRPSGKRVEPSGSETG